MSTKREELIESLRTAINKKHNTQLTYEQVEAWVGNDDECYTIKTYIDEVETYSSNEVTPSEIIEYYEDSLT